MESQKSVIRYQNSSLKTNTLSNSGYKLFISAEAQKNIAGATVYDQYLVNKSIQSLASRPRPQHAHQQLGVGAAYQNQITSGKWKVSYKVQSGLITVTAAVLAKKTCHGQMCRGVRMNARFERRMQAMLLQGHSGKGHGLKYIEAQWWWRNAKGKTLVMDGRTLSVWNVGGEFAAPFPLDDLKVHGHVTTSKASGRIFDGMYDFDRKPNPNNQIKMAIRNMLNEIAIWEHGAGTPFEIEYRYDDKFFK